ncbi:MAG: rhomboid family intramembrane serine protease [Bacteroidales bacterium]|jgi:membrane associated rhomboid family serine protease|nr:rhomboid family intramembrane serine protease [Bacteroidales bacterium]
MRDPEAAFFRKKLLLSMAIPGMLIVVIWSVFAVELITGFNAGRLGIFPLSLRGIPGIILSPLVHSDLKHLFNNSLPLFLLGTMLFFFYGEVSLKVFLINWVLTGLMVWLAGREAWHIGASGLVYGLAFFLFFSGIIRRHFRLMALSLLIVFLYGSMVWGMFPFVPANISWESHMLGAVSGIFLSVWYRNEGPQAPVHEWPDDDEEEEGEADLPSADGGVEQEL